MCHGGQFTTARGPCRNVPRKGRSRRTGIQKPFPCSKAIPLLGMRFPMPEDGIPMLEEQISLLEGRFRCPRVGLRCSRAKSTCSWLEFPRPRGGFPWSRGDLHGPRIRLHGPGTELPCPSVAFPCPCARLPRSMTGFPCPRTKSPCPSAKFPRPRIGLPRPRTRFLRSTFGFSILDKRSPALEMREAGGFVVAWRLARALLVRRSAFRPAGGQGQPLAHLFVADLPEVVVKLTDPKERFRHRGADHLVRCGF